MRNKSGDSRDTAVQSFFKGLLRSLFSSGISTNMTSEKCVSLVYSSAVISHEVVLLAHDLGNDHIFTRSISDRFGKICGAIRTHETRIPLENTDPGTGPGSPQNSCPTQNTEADLDHGVWVRLDASVHL